MYSDGAALRMAARLGRRQAAAARQHIHLMLRITMRQIIVLTVGATVLITVGRRAAQAATQAIRRRIARPRIAQVVRRIAPAVRVTSLIQAIESKRNMPCCKLDD